MTDQNNTSPAIIITGASAGIGRALALEAATERLPLVLVARSEAPLQALAAELQQRGVMAHVLPLDLGQPDAGRNLDTFLAESRLHADILVNNAGFGLLGDAAKLDRAEQLAMVDLNVRAATDLALQLLPGMLERGRGGILNVGSMAGFMPGPGMATYYATKAYLRSFSEALWEESRRAGVTVSCLAPGPVETGFLARAGADKARLFSSRRNMDAATCAAIGWAAFKAGKRMVVPGLSGKLALAAVHFMPQRLVLHAVRRLQKARKG
jgi:uncharacterized protein